MKICDELERAIKKLEKSDYFTPIERSGHTVVWQSDFGCAIQVTLYGHQIARIHKTHVDFCRPVNSVTTTRRINQVAQVVLGRDVYRGGWLAPYSARSDSDWIRVERT